MGNVAILLEIRLNSLLRGMSRSVRCCACHGENGAMYAARVSALTVAVSAALSTARCAVSILQTRCRRAS